MKNIQKRIFNENVKGFNISGVYQMYSKWHYKKSTFSPFRFLERFKDTMKTWGEA